jgi:hypothetical protein
MTALDQHDCHWTQDQRYPMGAAVSSRTVVVLMQRSERRACSNPCSWLPGAAGQIQAAVIHAFRWLFSVIHFSRGKT